MDSVKKSKKLIISMVICIVMAIVIGFVGFIVPNLFDFSSERSSKEIRATVSSVEKAAKKNIYLIYLEENNICLVAQSEALADVNSLLKLSKGTIIYFKVMKELEDELTNSESDQIPVLAIKTELNEIMTLESHKLYEKHQRFKAKIGASIFSVFFLFVAMFFLWKYLRNTKGRGNCAKAVDIHLTIMVK